MRKIIKFLRFWLCEKNPSVTAPIPISEFWKREYIPGGTKDTIDLQGWLEANRRLTGD